MILLITILVLWTISHSIVVLLPYQYLSEIILSFLPYSNIGHFFVCCLIIFFIIKERHTSKKIIAYLSLVWIITLWYSQYTKYYQYYYTTSAQVTAHQRHDISFLYANIYYKNNDFSWLLSTIREHNPDIILFVEYAKIHDDALKDTLDNDYPYRNRSIWGKHFDGDVVYSRYPLTKIDHTIEKWSRSFSHVTIQKNHNPLDIILVHTSAPISQAFLDMRTSQIEKLSDMIQDYYNTDQTQREDIIILGDFNLSPRSPHYTAFNQEMNNLNFYDISQTIRHTKRKHILPSTRCHQSLTFVCSHIDHIRSNNTNMTLQYINIPWSDHDGFVGRL